MKKFFEKTTIIAIHLVCVFILTEVSVNYFAFKYLFPIKNATSFGYVTRKSIKTIIPLNVYSSRFKAQLALPFELAKFAFKNNKELVKSYDDLTKKYGYKNQNGKLVVDYKFDKAEEYNHDYAIVAISIDNSLKYGTIDKNGNWIIEPKYEHLCPFLKYYTKACIDKKHCGVIDKYGNEITLMSYKTDRIGASSSEYKQKLCLIGDKNQVRCNYFL